MSSSSRASRARSGFFTLVVGVFVFVGCSGTGSGCSTLTPIPGNARYSGPKNDNAVNIRLSANGINYLNSNWQTLVQVFAPGNTLALPVPCTPQSTPVGDVAIADMGSAGCTDESCGRMDGQCTAADRPANVQATITGFSLVPRPPDQLDATVQIQVDTNDIPLASRSNNFALCIGLSRFKCAVRFNTRAQMPNDNRIRATVKFSINTKWDKLLAFEVTGFRGTDVCGATGAPTPPDCLQAQDISLNGQNVCGDIYCGLADLDIVKTTLLQLISPLLQDQIKKLVGDQTCEACGTGKPACPRSTDGSNVQSSCTSNICQDTAAMKCVPRFLGVEGEMSLGGLLGAFGAPADAKMQLSLAAGSSVTVDQGLSFGTRVGIQSVNTAPCVPPAAAPPMTAVTAPNFDGEATPGSNYHVGLGVSSNFLNVAFHAAHQSGALCLALNSDNVGLINTGLFKTFLPSLGKIATRDGKDAPMMVVLRPARPPTTTIGLGTYDPVTKKPIKPLITLLLPDVSVDFYAMLDDRYARLFTLTADISLPLSLIFEGCDKVTPALGDLKMLIGNIRTGNSEMLAEDPQVLADLVPAVIGLAEPALAKALQGFALPALGNFKLKVNEVKGLGNIAGSEAYNHLGIYAQLLPANAMCATSAPRMIAALKESRMPRAEDMRLNGHKTLQWPEAVLAVQALGKSGTAEYSFRIDDGLWTDFVPAANGELVVSHPRFLLQGLHTIELRTRMAEDPHGVSTAERIGFRVDWEAPELSLTADTAHDRVVVNAHDVITSSDKLLFAYRVGNGAFSEFGPAREISLSAIEKQGGVTVRAIDELGNVGEAIWRVPDVALRPDAVPDSLGTAKPETAGCSAVGGLEVLALGLSALVLRRRRAR